MFTSDFKTLMPKIFKGSAISANITGFCKPLGTTARASVGIAVYFEGVAFCDYENEDWI